MRTGSYFFAGGGEPGSDCADGEKDSGEAGGDLCEITIDDLGLQSYDRKKANDKPQVELSLVKFAPVVRQLRELSSKTKEAQT